MEEKRLSNEENQYVVIGKVLDTYGLRGDLKVEPYLDPKHWQKIKRVFLKHKQRGYVSFNIATLRPHGNRMLIIHFEGYDSLPQVEGFRGAKVFLPKGEIPARGKEEYYESWSKSIFSFQIYVLPSIPFGNHRPGKHGNTLWPYNVGKEILNL